MAILIKRKINGKTLSLEAGRMARLANGAVMVRYADTAVLCTATMDEARPGIDFFPLTVDYREKISAAGKIPGGFFKREGRPTTKEILTCRMIDRPTRPLFPDGFRKEIQIQCIVLSADDENESDVLAMLGASAALAISDIPWQGPTGSVRIGLVDGKLISFPTFAEIERSELNLIVAGTENAITMVEGGARELSESAVVDALDEAQRVIRTLVGMVQELVQKIGRDKVPFEPPAEPEGLEGVRAYLESRLPEALAIGAKQARSHALDALKTECLAHFVADEEERQERAGEFSGMFHTVLHDVMRDMIRQGARVDSRRLDEIRPITIEAGLMPRTHGSALFTRGETQALATCTLGTTADKQIVDGLQEEVKKHFLLHYNFPPFSVGECRPIRGPGRREIGHGALAERALESLLPSPDEFPYTIRIVSDILESNGSSSMATVCAGSLSLMDAGVKLQRPVAGIAMGLLKEGKEFYILSDILGDEDHHGDMDFKVAGTDRGITALQMDIKIDGVTRDVLSDALEQAREGRLHILREMKKVLPRPRSNLSPFAPRFHILKINPDKIGLLIGPGGKTVRKIQEETGAKIEIVDEQGRVAIYATSDASLEGARKQVEALTAEAEVGKRYTGKVMSIKDFGAFIEIIPGQDGLLHISDMGNGYVNRVSDLFRPGDLVDVVVEDINDFGKIRLVLAEPATKEAAPKEKAPPPRRDRRDRPTREPDKVVEIAREEEEEEEDEDFEDEDEDFEDEDEDFEDEEVDDEDEDFDDEDEDEDFDDEDEIADETPEAAEAPEEEQVEEPRPREALPAEPAPSRRSSRRRRGGRRGRPQPESDRGREGSGPPRGDRRSSQGQGARGDQGRDRPRGGGGRGSGDRYDREGGNRDRSGRIRENTGGGGRGPRGNSGGPRHQQGSGSGEASRRRRGPRRRGGGGGGRRG